MKIENNLIESFSTTRILCVGDVMLDQFIRGTISRISPEAPVPVVQVGKIDERLGGAANVARNVAALGANTTILGIVGNDESGKRVVDLLKSGGVDSQLEIDANVPKIGRAHV